MADELIRRNLVWRLTVENENAKKELQETKIASDELAKGIMKVGKANEEAAKSSKDHRKELVNQIKDIRVFGVSLGGVTRKLSGVRTSLVNFRKGFLGAARGANVLKAALISTGIGALIVALGAVVTFLTRTQKGMDLVERATAAVGAVFTVLKDRVSTLGENLVNAFSNPLESLKALGDAIKENVLNRFRSLGVFIEAISLAFDGEWTQAADRAKTAAIQLATGLDEVQQSQAAETIAGIVEEVKEEVKVTDNLTKRLQALRKARIELDVATARSRAEQKELNRIVEDTTKNFTDRIAAARRVEQLESSLLARRIALQQEEVNILIARQAISKNTLEDDRELADARIALANLVEESEERQTTNQNKLNILIEQRRQAIKKLGEEYVKLSLDIEIASNPDPIRRLQLQTLGAIDEINRAREERLGGLSLLGLTPEKEAEERKRINEVFDGLIELEKTKLRQSVAELDNELASLNQFDAFVQGAANIEEVLPQDQFNAIVQRVKVLQREIGAIGTIDNVNELRLKERLEAELEELIALLGDSPEAKEIKRLLGLLFGIDQPDEKETKSFLERLGFDKKTQRKLQDAIKLASDSIGQLFDEQEERITRDVELQRSRVDELRDLGRDNTDETLRNEQERLDGLLEQQAQAQERQEALAAAEIATQKALAVAKTAAGLADAISKPFPANLVAFPLVLALIAQIAGAANGIGGLFQGFKDGTDYVNGPGTSRSDSIFARLSKGEGVVDAQTNNLRLRAGLNNENLAALSGLMLTNGFSIPLLKQEIVSGYSRTDNEAQSNSSLVKEVRKLQKINQALLNKREKGYMDKKAMRTLANRIQGQEFRKRLS